MAPDELLSREEVLGGLPARRARVVLFLIERQAAHMVARSGQLAELLPGEQAARERDLAFVQAFALGREAPVRLTIQNLERYAKQWAHLVPDNPTLRASLARLLAQKYTFTVGAIPGIRGVLGLDQDAVREAYQRLHGQPLETIYAERATWHSRARWAWAALGGWLDALPPFWFVFVFTLTLGLPQAIVAFPIAVATVGPLPGIALNLAAGLLSVVTTAAVAEAAARSGIVRYGTAYIGKLAADYLGAAGSGLFSLAIFVLYLVTVMGGCFAISRTLGKFTHVPPVAWTAVLFAAGIWLLARGSISLSLTLLLALAIVIITLMLAIIALTLGHFRLEHLLRPSTLVTTERQHFLGNTIGIILMGYFAEAFVVQCAKVVLPREPSGRALIWGSLAGLGGIAVVLSLWIVVMNGSLDSRLLAGETVTVITPLAAVVGSGAAALGTLLILFLPGLATLRCMVGAFNVAREWIPARSEPVVVLPRRGRLVFQRRGTPAGGPIIGLSYLGFDGSQARFRLNLQLGPLSRQEEASVSGYWNVARVFAKFPEWQKLGSGLELNVIVASGQSVSLRVKSSLVMGYQDIWNVETLSSVAPPASRASTPAPSSWSRLLSDRSRFLLSISPIALTFLMSGWFLAIGWDSFPAVLGILGVISSSIFSGIIPVLLIASSRKKGEVVPGVVLKFVGHPLVLGAVYLIYVVVLLSHGLFIWENPVSRASALLVTVVAFVVTVVTARRGSYKPRVVVEMRLDQREGQRSAFSVVAGGQPAPADVRLHYPDRDRDQRAANGEVAAFGDLRTATFQIPASGGTELKVWVHRVTPSGDSEGLPALLDVRDGGDAKRFDLGLSGGQVVVPISGRASEILIAFPEPAPS
ncbi:MAG: hypothetical protein DMD91_16725 [Candidatus Rokuibacteriota bacterium]|nr:MAG: hypothetical protein DMD91_16725 [Candidatus Rokubacteria bacterium]